MYFRSVAEELHDDDNTHDSQGNTVDTCSQASPSCADTKQPAINGVKDLVEAPVPGIPGNRIADAYFSCKNGQSDDFESILQHQARLTEKYEAEDRAQREWEEKVRENSSCALVYLTILISIQSYFYVLLKCYISCSSVAHAKKCQLQ